MQYREKNKEETYRLLKLTWYQSGGFLGPLLNPPCDQKKHSNGLDSIVESTELMEHLNPQTESILTSLTTKMTEVLSRSQTSQYPPPANSSTTPISIKLNDSNFALWSQVVEMYISGKDKLGYINEDFPQPLKTDLTFRRWQTENAIVKDG
jgi:hypothetical protein